MELVDKLSRLSCIKRKRESSLLLELMEVKYDQVDSFI